jgi:predicted dehydrogenase
MRNGVNVAVIGLGRAGEKHALVYDKLPFVNLVAVCDKDDHLVRRYSELLGTTGYTDFRDLMDDPTVDAVSVVLPDTLHLDATKTALERGKHILLEKPIASNMADAKQILDLAEQSNRVFMVAHILRHMPQHSLAQQRIAGGEIGDIVHVAARRNSSIAGARAYSSHHTDTSVHLMVHDIDYINWIVASKVNKVFAKARQILLTKYDMNDTVIAMLEYENGVIATLEACWILPDNSPRELDDKIEVIGTKGAVYIDGICTGLEIISSANDRVEMPDTVAWPQINDTIGGSIFEEIVSFVNCMIKGTKPLVGACEAYQALRVVDAIQRSISQGGEITLL